ncbi:MAG TPA: sodium-dependent bicarbonate transport family permease [Gemmataceae bacterium]|nr:sodium-dependent bicarbonate transport family permease [Gemmataceae bacterium]
MELLAVSFGGDFWLQFAQKIFQPLLLFFYLGFLIPILKVPYQFPKQIYQGITLYLLVAIGWHGGEELAKMSGADFQEAMGFVVLGFSANVVIGVMAYFMLRKMTRMRRIDCATVGGYYGSDSAGTFLTCVGVLTVMGYEAFGYMPVMLAVMETPGCLVCLYQIARLRRQGMDKLGNMPDEEGYMTPEVREDIQEREILSEEEVAVVGRAGQTVVAVRRTARVAASTNAHDNGRIHEGKGGQDEAGGLLTWKIVHEVFFNPGLYFLFGGIFIGLVAGKLFIPYQKEKVIASENLLFVTLMHGVLCLFLLEMGITACERLRDLKKAGPGFIVFGLLAPNLFALFGMVLAHLYSMALGHPFPLPTYALFAVLCGAASYIAVPAVQRMAIPEASPTLPLAASLGLTFTWNVTLGIPLYIAIAELLMTRFPVTGG